MISEPDAAQRLGSDPAVSAFVAASAGSGKTKLLTDRLLRLLLDGADPGRIQCLTFTKAAAAEMAIRLRNRLGAWVTAADGTLDDDLAGFGLLPSPELRTRARALFAVVLDLPGGMRIGTIHAFCQSLLRRFPLEARLQPHFRLIEDLEADLALREAREAMLAESHEEDRRTALRRLAGLVSLDQFGGLVRQLERDRNRLARVGALQANESRAAIERVTRAACAPTLAQAVTWRGEADVRAAARLVIARDKPAKAKCSEEMLRWLARDGAARAASWDDWRCIFLTGKGEPRAMSGLVNDKVAATTPEIVDAFAREQARILEADNGLRARDVADVSHALLTLAEPVSAAYRERKAVVDHLDFDDLIGRTRELLVDPGAAWVLYKLDGGLDHLLLDEVQDTAPAQWAIAGALTAEFFAGAGASERRRTIFAVGDRKQSIFSFQGAEPDEFERWRGILGKRVTDAGAAFRNVPLNVSFRSTQPVLALVDAVFADSAAAKGVVDAPPLTHRAHRAGHAGRIELWPLTPVPDAEKPEPWEVPDHNLGGTNAPQRLADTLAAWIKRETEGSVMLDSQGRPLAPGDVLVLVRTRNDFARALVRALKQRNVPVAGMDRMVLSDQPAVADLLALCDALLLPQDELQFACMLTSPVGGLSDDSLMRLAIGRRGTLWDALRDRAFECPDWTAAHDRFAALLARVDYATPHALLAEALGPLGARARLLGRLGPEAAEPIDELLRMALDYARTHPPSLQGFVHWLRQSGATEKREAEGSGHVVRIMTVHGAKGLQAPLVILPETTTAPQEDGQLLWAHDAETGIDVPVWSPNARLRCTAIDRLRADALAKQTEEYNRLLYVALTRAEDRLVVCGWQTRHPQPAGNWYELVANGFSRLPSTEEVSFGVVPDAWPGALRRYETPQTIPPVRATAEVSAAPQLPLPAWTGRAPHWTAEPPPPEPARPSPLAPSRPEDAAFGPVPASASPLAAAARNARFKRGRLVHALLQHLPALPASARPAAAQRYLSRPGSGIDPSEIDDLVAEVAAILEDPVLAPLFGPAGRAEVPLTGVIGNAVIGGLVDRLAVLEDHVIAADYKTNRVPPADAGRSPVLYLRQMAAYRAVLRGAFPAHRIVCALIWTATAFVMPLPDALLDAHAPDAEPPGLIAVALATT
jgi:ATP-dependent helicase/nuclease subunit A